MRTAHRSIIAATAVVALLGAVAGTAAAATSTPSPSASSTAKATAAATPGASSAPLVGGSPATWTPVTVTRKEKGKSISLVKEQFVVFKGFANKVHFSSSDPKVFRTVDAKTTGTSTSNPGGQAVGSGTAKVTAKNGSTVVATYTITVK